jgi:hypothetical protein
LVGDAVEGSWRVGDDCVLPGISSVDEPVGGYAALKGDGCSGCSLLADFDELRWVDGVDLQDVGAVEVVDGDGGEQLVVEAGELRSAFVVGGYLRGSCAVLVRNVP